MKKTAPTYFATPAEFRVWLAKHHDSESELWVGFHKRATGRPSMTWSESVGEALCFGWIDGIRKSIDEDRYQIRFTPRKPGSIWSAVNLRRAQELIDAGLMQPPGRAAFERRDVQKTRRYSFERERVELDPAYERTFRRNARAWQFFTEQPPSYRKQMTWYVMSAVRPDTRERRLQRLIADSAAGKRIDPMRPASDR